MAEPATPTTTSAEDNRMSDGAGDLERPGKGRSRFLLMCGHPPHHDPRILYMADTLAREGEVLIVHCADYGKKDPASSVYRRYSCRSFRSGKGRSLIRLLRDYWPWFNPRNLPIVPALIKTAWRRWRDGKDVGHLHDVTLGFLPFCARVLTNRDFDFIVSCDSYIMEGALMVKRLTGDAKLIYDAHEVFYSEINQGLERERKLRRLEEKWLQHVDRLFVVSKGIQALYLKRNPHLRGRIHCLANCIPFQGVKSGRIMTNTDGPVRFLFQGGYSRTRGIDRLMEIWARVPPCNATLSLRMVGIPKEDVEDVHALAERCGKANPIIFDTPVKEDDLVEACVGYDVGVIPYIPETSLSHHSCCPNKFGQYLNSGCAVLTTDSRYLRRLVKELDCGWSYDHNNVDSAAAVIHRIATDRQELHRKRLNALHHAEHTYNWDIMDRIVETAVKV